MGMTMTQKILAKHAHRDSVSAGDLLVSQVDLVLANDITGPPAINEFEKIGKPVFDKKQNCSGSGPFLPLQGYQIRNHVQAYA